MSGSKAHITPIVRLSMLIVVVVIVVEIWGIDHLAVAYWSQPPGGDFCCHYTVSGGVYRGLSGELG